MRALLDINVLIALLDANHVHHARSTRWLDSNVGQGWASCPLTQNGCVRILSPPNYPNTVPAAEVAAFATYACTNSRSDNAALHSIAGPCAH